MIKGIGTDIIEVARIRKNIEQYGQTFYDKILTPDEKRYSLTYADPAPTVAGRFAAKEAVAKALGTGFGEHLSFHDIEVLNDTVGKPIIRLSPKAKAHFNPGTLHLSISHNKEHAIAFALWET